MLVLVLLKILEQLSLKESETILLTNYNYSTCWPNRQELLKSKLSSKKNKSVIKWKGSITALRDFFRKKFGCKGQWSYIEAGWNRPATWR